MKRIAVLQRRRQKVHGQILIADRPQEPADGERPDRCRARIRRRRKRSAVHHRVRDFDAGRLTLDDDLAGPPFDDRRESARIVAVGVIEL